MGEFERLRSWFTHDPTQPGRLSADDPEVQRLIQQIAPGSHATELGGWVSLNLHLEASGLVLRVHQPFVSRRRVHVVQCVRERLAAAGLTVPVAVQWHGSTVLRCRRHVAEMEPYLQHDRKEPSLDAYLWLFGALGELHRAMAPLRLPVSRPVLASYTPPTTLRRWLAATTAAVADDPEASEVTTELRGLLSKLATVWVPSTQLPRQAVHGDIHLANVGTAPSGRPCYLDFGNMSIAPRIHDVAYGLAHMVFAMNGYIKPDLRAFPWQEVPRLVQAYEAAAGWRLTKMEKRALTPYVAAVPIHYATRSGFFADPAAVLHSERPFLELSQWLLTHPANKEVAADGRRGLG